MSPSHGCRSGPWTSSVRLPPAATPLPFTKAVTSTRRAAPNLASVGIAEMCPATCRRKECPYELVLMYNGCHWAWF